jgi:hypothetical protein
MELRRGRGGVRGRRERVRKDERVKGKVVGVKGRRGGFGGR